MSASLTLPCPRCGAALPADPMRREATCHYCHAHVPIPDEFRQRALEHLARVAAARSKADAAEKAASQLRMWSGGQQVGLVMVGAVVMIMVGLGVLANVLGPYLPRDALAVIMPIAIYGTLISVGVGYYLHQRRRNKTGAAPLAVAASVCERCGGPLVFVAGGTSAVCHACNATALAGKTIVRDLADAAERRAADLELERVRAERQMYRNMAGAQRFGHYYMYFAIGWPVAAIGVIGFIAGVSELVSGLASGKAREITHGFEAFGIGCLCAFGAASVAALVYAFLLRPALRPGVVLRAIAARIGGVVTQGGTGTAIDWLDAHWPGPSRYEVMVGYGEMMRYTLVTSVERLPALVVVLSGGANVACARLHVLVASPRRRDEAAVLATPPARELARLGFEIKAGEAGITLTRQTADAAVVTEPILGWVIGACAAVARA